MANMLFPWSDGWWLEENQAWLCGGEICALFCMDMNTLKCKSMMQIPESSIDKFRSFPYCIKYKNTIFCLPSMGFCVWCWKIDVGKWEKIEIEDKQRLFLYMLSYKPGSDRVWMVEAGTGRLLGLNLEKREFENKYYIPKHEDSFLGQYVLVEKKIYVIDNKRIYCVDTETNDIQTYKLPDVKAKIYTICYDGLNFWLSGYCKEIYVWNPACGVTKVITEFPKEFGLYLFQENNFPIIDYSSFFCKNEAFFVESICLGNYVWFIPGQSTEVLYIDKEKYSVRILQNTIEQEKNENQKRYLLPTRYAVEYVREGRYIGLYSFKTCQILEIDTVELSVAYRDYALNDEVELSIMKAYYQEKNLLQENKMCDLKCFLKMLKTNSKIVDNLDSNVGETVYHNLVQ